MIDLLLTITGMAVLGYVSYITGLEEGRDQECEDWIAWSQEQRERRR